MNGRLSPAGVGSGVGGGGRDVQSVTTESSLHSEEGVKVTKIRGKEEAGKLGQADS